MVILCLFSCYDKMTSYVIYIYVINILFALGYMLHIGYVCVYYFLAAIKIIFTFVY